MKLILMIPTLVATTSTCGGLFAAETSPTASHFRPSWTVQSADVVVLAQPGPDTAGPQMTQESALVATACLPGETLTSYWLPDDDADDASAGPPVQGGGAPVPPAPPVLKGPPVQPSDGTQYTQDQYQKQQAAWLAKLRQAKAEWEANYQAADHAWDQQQVAQLRQAAQAPAPEDLNDEPWDVVGGLQRAAVSLHLNHPTDAGTIAGRTPILVVLVNLGQLSPPASLPAGELARARVILANYDGPTPAATWLALLKTAGASDPVTVIPAALTGSQLSPDFAALMGSPGC
jgi:hypothetical protein